MAVGASSGGGRAVQLAGAADRSLGGPVVGCFRPAVRALVRLRVDAVVLLRPPVTSGAEDMLAVFQERTAEFAAAISTGVQHQLNDARAADLTLVRHG